MRFRLLLVFSFLCLLVGALAIPGMAAAKSTVQLSSTRVEAQALPMAPKLDAKIVSNSYDRFVIAEAGTGFGAHQFVGLAVKFNNHGQSIYPGYTKANNFGGISPKITVYSKVHHAWFLCIAQSSKGTAIRYVYRW